MGSATKQQLIENLTENCCKKFMVQELEKDVLTQIINTDKHYGWGLTKFEIKSIIKKAYKRAVYQLNIDN
jgi:hypothetical protein